MINVVVNQSNRNNLLRWLARKTSVTMESGAACWPDTELEAMRSDSVVRVTKKGVSIVFPMRGSQASHGINKSIRDFCSLTRRKFPAVVDSHTPVAPKKQIQERLL